MDISRRGFIGLASSAAAALAVAGCSAGGSSYEGSTAGSVANGSKKAVTLQIFAANSLEKALPEVQELYTGQTGVAFADTQFKASGDLVEQMRAGAVTDLLITASSGTMDDADSAGLIDADTREGMFTNDLVIVKKGGSDVQVGKIDDVVNVDRIAVGDAMLVPAGKYANQALYSVGLYTGAEGDDGTYADAIKDKVNAGADKVGTVASYVSSGDCGVGFVYSSDIYRYDGIETAFTCPEDSHKPIVYPGAVAGTSKHAKAAKEFLDFCMTSKKAQKVWAKYGFELSA